MQKVGGSWQIQQHLWATLNGIGGAAGVTGQAALWGTLRKQKAALREGMLGGGGWRRQASLLGTLPVALVWQNQQGWQATMAFISILL